MGKIAPLGNVYQAGTLSGNPLSVAAGLATLRLIQQPGFHDTLGRRSARLAAGLADAARDAGIAMTTDSVGGMFGFYFSDTVPASYAEATRCDITRFKAFFHAMLDEGVYLAPSAYEAGFISIAHTDELVEQTISAARRALSRV
ncbi:Glutamate-1-semialdehyde 2,1-aminomutase [compost metagenome]